MTEQRSTTYAELMQAAASFEPEEPLATHLVINDLQPDALQQELDDFVQGAEAFGVAVGYIVDDVEVSALVAITGPAARVADLASFMDGAEVVGAR
jgi:hypothetical protein